MNARKRKTNGPDTVAVNRKARHDYFLEDGIEAGLVLQGWEVKAMRAGRAQLRDGYVLLKDREAWLLGAHITPLPTASTHIHPDPQRSRKLLLHRAELSKLIGAVERRGYALIPTKLYWNKGRAKLAVSLAKGKKNVDKRHAEKDRDWQREKQRVMRDH